MWQKVKQWALNGTAREVVRTRAIRQACTADPNNIVERVWLAMTLSGYA